MSSASRRHLIPHKTLSKTTISAQNPDETPPLTDDDGDSDIDNDSNPSGLTMLPAELRVIRRLAQRVNVLPVIGRADFLTDDKLRAVKATVRRELYEADLGFGVFTPEPVKFSQSSFSREDGAFAADGKVTSTINGNGAMTGDDAESESESESDDEDNLPSRRVITLRSGRQSAPPRRSHSRSRLELPEEAREPQSPDPLDPESVANVRFSASTVARSDLSPLLPFAIIAPEKYRWHRPKPAAEASVRDAASENMQSPSSNSDSPITPAVKGQSWPSVTSPPDDLKGVFVRRFRWGTVDVLDPIHCDFAALRTAVLSTHMKVTLAIVSGLQGGSYLMTRCSRRTRAKFCMRNSAQKNYLHDALLRRLARNKQRNSSRVCLPLPLIFTPSTQHQPLSRSRVVNLTLSPWPVQNIVPVKIWIPFPLLLPYAVYTY